MSDYTPSTNEIRNLIPRGDVNFRTEFDRWLEQFGISEQLKERERIIALLEALDSELWCGTNLQIIDLINGEN